MSKLHLIFASGTIFQNNGELHEGAEEFLKKCIKNGYECVFMTHDTNKGAVYSGKLTELLGKKITFYNRKIIRPVFSKPENISRLKTTIVIGANDNDLFLATTYKLLYLYPVWDSKEQEKAIKYGFHIDNFNKLFECIKIIENQTKFYYTLEIDEKTTLYALTSANDNIATQNESQMIAKFKKVLKEGDRTDFQALFFHMISSIMKSDNLRKIDIWGIMPSSSTRLNDDMLEIKDRCRYLTNRRMKKDVFIRHTAVTKSHQTSYEIRRNVGAKKHLDSIMINPELKGRLKGKTVCILDDYVTNGISFEALRNLLLNEGVEKIYFFAFGRFKRGQMGIYQKEDYIISGDAYTKNYTYELVSVDKNFGDHGVYDHSAREEVDNIKNILL